MKRLLLATVMLASKPAIPQEHPYLSYFQLTEGFGTVQLSWEMIAGNTCNGITILRGPDSLALAPIDHIPGLCGELTAPVPFTWTDPSPPELSTLYYRLELGTNGFSSVQRIHLLQVIESEHRVIPSPASGSALLLLRLPPTATVDLRIWSAHGELVTRKDGSIGPRHPLDLSRLRSGIYLYEAVSGEQRFRGRFAVIAGH